MNRNAGTSLTEALMAVAVVTFLALAGASAFFAQTRLGKRINERMQRVILQAELGTVLRDADSCSCQLDSTKNTAAAGVLFIDSTNPSPAPISLTTFRSGCDFSSSTNIVATNGSTMNNSNLTVGEVWLGDITSQSSTEYTANLHVSLTANGEPLPDAVSPIRFTIDTTTGTPSHRRIAACMSPTVGLGPVSCPAGYSIIGTPLMDGTHCIDSSNRGPASFVSAVATCANLSIPGYSGFHICGLRELNNVCSTSPGVLPGGGNNLITEPWPDGNYVFWTGGAGNCNGLGIGGNSGQYRCCFK